MGNGGVLAGSRAVRAVVFVLCVEKVATIFYLKVFYIDCLIAETSQI
jgi:hypothetical protein